MKSEIDLFEISDPRLRVLDASAACSLFRRHSIRPAVVCLVASTVLLAGVGVIAYIQGNLTHENALHTFARDMEGIFAAKSSTDTYFPYLRDYPTLIILLFTGVTIGLAYRNFLLMERFLPQLRKKHLIYLEPDNIDAVAELMQRSNLRFAYIRRARPLLIFVSMVVASLLMAAAKYGRTFETLTPNGSARADKVWETSAYSGWWASVDEKHWLGALTYFVGATLIVYVVIKHNLVGGCFVAFFVSGRALIGYRADRHDRDGFQGWRIMAMILINIFFCLAISVVAFASLFILVPVRSAPWAIPFLLLYFVGIPVSTIIPIRLINRALSDFQKREIQRVVDSANRIRKTIRRDSIEWFQVESLERAEIESITRLRPRLFRSRTIVIAAVIYVLPAITSIISVILSYLQVVH